MKGFGKYAVVNAAEYHFKDEPELFWKFKPATSMDELAMAQFYDNTNRTLTDRDGNPVVLGPHWIEVMWREIALAFGGTNVQNESGVGLKNDASVDEIEKFLAEMPRDMVEEIWSALGEAVPGWGPVKPRAAVEAGTTNSET